MNLGWSGRAEMEGQPKHWVKFFFLVFIKISIYVYEKINFFKKYGVCIIVLKYEYIK